MDDELDGSDIAEHWSLALDTLSWVETKAGPQRLGLAAQLRYDALTGRFEIDLGSRIDFAAAARAALHTTSDLSRASTPPLSQVRRLAGMRRALPSDKVSRVVRRVVQ
jgi:hypothetical protein